MIAIGGPPTEDIVPKRPLAIDAKNRFLFVNAGAIFITEKKTENRIRHEYMIIKSLADTITIRSKNAKKTPVARPKIDIFNSLQMANFIP